MKPSKKIITKIKIYGLSYQRKFAVSLWYNNRGSRYENHCLTIIDRIDCERLRLQNYIKEL